MRIDPESIPYLRLEMIIDKITKLIPIPCHKLIVSLKATQAIIKVFIGINAVDKAAITLLIFLAPRYQKT